MNANDNNMTSLRLIASLYIYQTVLYFFGIRNAIKSQQNIKLKKYANQSVYYQNKQFYKMNMNTMLIEIEVAVGKLA